MKPKEIFWSGLKGGLFEQKHRKAMGEAVWLFGWLCMRQSQINGSGEGLPHYGNPLTFAEIAEDTGFPASTLRKWAAVLTRTGYIHTRRTGNLGLVFFIHKAKSKAKSGKNSCKVADKSTAKCGQSADAQVRPDMDAPSEQVRPSLDGVPPKDGRTYANKSFENEQVIENTNTLTSKSLSNYRKGSNRMNSSAEDAAIKILLAFESGGIAPLEPEKFAQVREHVRSILGRAMESAGEKKARKWNDWQRVKNERRVSQ